MLDSNTQSLVLAIVVFSVDPDEPVENWSSLAATVYCATRCFLQPAELESMYYKYLVGCGGFGAAKELSEKFMLGDVNRSRSILPFLKYPPKLHVKTEEAFFDDEKKMSSSSVSSFMSKNEQSSLKTRILAPEHLLSIVELFRAVEGFDTFKESVGVRVVNTVMSTNNYGSCVKQPVSIATIREDIRSLRIQTLLALECSIWKMASNCVYFNVPEGPYPGLARRFAAVCSGIIARESEAR